MMRLCLASLALTVIAASLAGCGNDGAAEEASVATAVVDASDAAATAVPGAADALLPNQRVQGTLEVDIGGGPRSYRALATTVDPNLGAVASERLASSEGQDALKRANAQAAGKVTVDAAQVQDLANAMAGKTFHDAELRQLDIIKTRSATLSGTAADGSKVTLSIRFPLDSDLPTDASFEFMPDGKRPAQSFVSSNDAGAVEVIIERFEAVDAGTWHLSGYFTARQLSPGVLAKTLQGQQITEVSGRFDIAELKFKR